MTMAMTESDVKLIARETVDAYEEKIGKPRHDANINKIDELIGAWNRFRGGIIAVGAVGSLPAIVLACVEIARFVRGH